MIETFWIGGFTDQTLVILCYESGQVELVLFNLDNLSFEPCDSSAISANVHKIEKIVFDIKATEIYFVTEEGEIYWTWLEINDNLIDNSIKETKLWLKLIEELVGLNDEIMEVKFIGNNHAVVCSNSETLRVLNLETGSGALVHGHEDLITAVDVFQNKFMITGSKDGKVFYWKISKNFEELNSKSLELLDSGPINKI